MGSTLDLDDIDPSILKYLPENSRRREHDLFIRVRSKSLQELNALINDKIT